MTLHTWLLKNKTKFRLVIFRDFGPPSIRDLWHISGLYTRVVQRFMEVVVDSFDSVNYLITLVTSIWITRRRSLFVLEVPKLKTGEKGGELLVCNDSVKERRLFSERHRDLNRRRSYKLSVSKDTDLIKWYFFYFIKLQLTWVSMCLCRIFFTWRGVGGRLTF